MYGVRSSSPGQGPHIWTARGTHQGELRGIPATGKQVPVTGITISRFVDGKEGEAWVKRQIREPSPPTRQLRDRIAAGGARDVPAPGSSMGKGCGYTGRGSH